MRRPLARLLVPLLVLGLVAAACGDDDDDAAAPSATTAAGAAGATTSTAAGGTSDTTAAAPTTAVAATTAAPTTAAPTTTTTAVPASYALGQTTLAFEDTSRPTLAFEGLVDASPTRKLPTLVSYPAATAGTDVSVAKGGRYPLLVFSHGITADFHEFDQMYPALAAAGYIVATPNFPETTGGTDFRALPAIVQQPPDVQFVIDQMLKANGDPASPFHGSIDPSRIGIGGHSFGAMTSLLLAYNTRYGDPRVKAVYEASGSMYPVDGGTYDFAGKPPLLMIHGDADQTVGYQGALDLYPLAPTPKWFLTVQGAGHSTFFRAGDPGIQPQIDAVVGFYDLYLDGDAQGAAQIQKAVVAGVTTLQSQP